MSRSMNSAGALNRRGCAPWKLLAPIVGVLCILALTCDVHVCAAGDGPGATESPSVSAPIDPASAEVESVPNPIDSPVATLPPDAASAPPSSDNIPPTTVEIAPAVNPQRDQDEPELQATPPIEEDDSSSFKDNPDVSAYEQHQADDDASAPPPYLQTFLSADAIDTPIGIELREARRTLKSGEEADGLLVTRVFRGSPAAVAGIHAYSQGIHNALTATAIVAGLIIPPAILMLPVLEYTQVGESYDMIIGVDGARVTNFLDFQDQMRDLKPGEIVYLSVVRNGRRIQFRVDIPANANLASW